jgi:DNA-binding PadR family transcriptional regulator
MGTITLEALDTTVLRLLDDDPASGDELATAVEHSYTELTDRLEELAENGLLRERDDGMYALTESGTRVLDVPADGSTDSRIDAPDHVRQAIKGLDLRADREEAVFDAVAFLQYWGSATESELIDGIYSENPAEYETAKQWWQTFMRDTLAELPAIESPTADEESWQYTGTPEIDEHTEDGRRLFDDSPSSYGSVKHALEVLDLSVDQHTAVRAIFDVLSQHTATETELKQDVYEQTATGDAPADEWWTQWIEPILRELPGIEQMDEETWQYTGNEVNHNETSTQSDKYPKATIVDDTSTAETEAETDDICPVCQQPYDGRTYIEASETRLSGWKIPICVTASPAETPGGADITFYYHSSNDGT